MTLIHRLILSAIMLIIASPLASAANYRGSLDLIDWSPPEGFNSPEIRALSLKWELQDGNSGPLGLFYMQWYLGDHYFYQAEKINIRDLREEAKLLSFKTLVLHARVYSQGSWIGNIRFDMGATPPHGGVWGQQVRLTFPWESTFLMRGSDSGEMLSAEQTQQFFREGIELKKLAIYKVGFGGTFEIERAIEERKLEQAYQSQIAQAVTALSNGQFDQSLSFYQEALTLKPHATHLNDQILEVKYQQRLASGDSAFDQANYETAITQFEGAQQLIPSDSRAPLRIEKAQQMISLRTAYQKRIGTLTTAFEESLREAREAASNALMAAANAFQAEAEACHLNRLTFYQCEVDYLQKKLGQIEEQAKFEVYGALYEGNYTALEHPCTAPACDVNDTPLLDSAQSADLLLSTAERKYGVYQNTLFEAFLAESHALLDQSLQIDPKLGKAYFFRSKFAQDMIEQYHDLSLCLLYDSLHTEALATLGQLKLPFHDELYAKIAEGSTEYVAKALKYGLLSAADRHRGESLIDQALKYDQAEVLALLLEELPPQQSAQLLLHRAAGENKVNSARYLMTRGAAPDKLDATGESPLQRATENGSEAIVRLFLREKPELTVGPSVLRATEKGDANLLHAFLETGSHVNNADHRGDNLLMIAIRMEHLHLIDQLLAAGADVNHTNKEKMTALGYAAQKEYASIIRKLLDHQADPPLSLKVLSEKDQIATTFLCAQLMEYAFVHTSKSHAESSIAYDKKIALAQHTSGSTFITEALNQNLLSLADLMLESEVDFGQKIDGQYLLLTALQAKATSIATKLIAEYKVPTDIRNRKGEMPLHLAVHAGSKEIISLLLNSKHPLNEQDHLGNSPLYIALIEKRAAIADMLLDAGADIFIANEKEMQGLHLAVELGDIVRTRQFLNMGAKINERGENGMTPLHYAAKNTDRHMAEFLLAEGADREIKDFLNRTASKLARKSRDPQLAKLLK